MASETGDVLLSIRELRIDVPRHGDHHASGFLFGIGIAGEITLDVTVSALGDPKRLFETLHNFPDIRVSAQKLQVFRRGLFSAALFLGEQRDRKDQKQRGE